MNFSSLHNFYERLVFEYICDDLVVRYTDCDEEFFQDAACYALTRLPARYIRHDIDMAFYLAPGERDEMMQNVRQAVDKAAEFIYQRRQADAS